MNIKKIIIGIMLILMMCNHASAWYGDYENRRAITIDNSNIVEIDYYSVFINLTNTPINETSLIIVNETAYSVVPHFCSNVTGGNCYSLRFNCTHLPFQGVVSNTYYIYYNNSSTSSSSNGTNTFMKYDGFEGANIDSSIWDILIGGVTTSTDQSVTGSKSAKFTTSPDAITSTLTHSDNIAIEYSLYTSTTGDFGIARHGDGTECLTTYAFGQDIKYYDGVWRDTGANIANNQWGTFVWNDFNWTTHTCDISYNGSIIDDNIDFRPSYSSYNNQFNIYTAKLAYIDDFIVRKYYTSPLQASDWEVPGGYTCTGLSYDSNENCLWSADFTNEYVIKIAKNGTKLGEINNINIDGIQGVAYDSSDDTLWLSSIYDEKSYHIFKNGTYVGDNVSGYNGCSYEAASDSLWIMGAITNNITRIDASNGVMVQNISLSVGGDGLAYDASDDTLWYSRDSDNTIRHIYASNGTEIGNFACPASYPEGLTIDISDNTIWHADDSQYHAAVPNGNRIWHLTKAGAAESSGGIEPAASIGAEEDQPIPPPPTIYDKWVDALQTIPEALTLAKNKLFNIIPFLISIILFAGFGLAIMTITNKIKRW